MALAPVNPLAPRESAATQQAAADRARLSTLNRARRAYLRGDERMGRSLENSLRMQDALAASGAPIGSTRRAADIMSIAGGRLDVQDALIQQQRQNMAALQQMRSGLFSSGSAPTSTAAPTPTSTPAVAAPASPGELDPNAINPLTGQPVGGPPLGAPLTATPAASATGSPGGLDPSAVNPLTGQPVGSPPLGAPLTATPATAAPAAPAAPAASAPANQLPQNFFKTNPDYRTAPTLGTPENLYTPEGKAFLDNAAKFNEEMKQRRATLAEPTSPQPKPSDNGSQLTTSQAQPSVSKSSPSPTALGFMKESAEAAAAARQPLTTKLAAGAKEVAGAFMAGAKTVGEAVNTGVPALASRAAGAVESIAPALNTAMEPVRNFITGSPQESQQEKDYRAALLQARATGGPISAGTPYLVGEEGPEIVVPEKDGTVIPAKETKAVIEANKKKRQQLLQASKR